MEPLPRSIDGGGAEPAAPVKGGTAAAGEEEGEEEHAPQLHFLRQLCAAMQAAGYQLLTRQEWQAALCENFMVGAGGHMGSSNCCSPPPIIVATPSPCLLAALSPFIPPPLLALPVYATSDCRLLQHGCLPAAASAVAGAAGCAGAAAAAGGAGAHLAPWRRAGTSGFCFRIVAGVQCRQLIRCCPMLRLEPP